MERVRDVYAANWEEEVSKSEVLTVVYFWHQQCPWCLRLTPIIYEVAGEYDAKIKFVRLNILESPSNQEIAGNFGVMGTPTLMFLCNGRPVGQTVGFVSKEDLRRILDDVLQRYKQCAAQSTPFRPAYVV